MQPSPRAILVRYVLPSRTLAPLERIEIYSRMYFLRLRDALREDYPAVAHALGPRRFDDVVRSYLRAHPSRFYNLNRLGHRLPGFLARRRSLPHRPLLADLARLEWAITEVFDAPRSATANASGWTGLDPERWARARFRPIPALRLLELRYPVHAYARAVREGKRPRIPRPRRAWVVVYRKDDVVWRMPIERAAFETLSALARGRTLRAALLAAARRGRFRASERKVASWFRTWVAEKFFEEIVPPRARGRR